MPILSVVGHVGSESGHLLLNTHKAQEKSLTSLEKVSRNTYAVLRLTEQCARGEEFGIKLLVQTNSKLDDYLPYQIRSTNARVVPFQLRKRKQRNQHCTAPDYREHFMDIDREAAAFKTNSSFKFFKAVASRTPCFHPATQTSSRFLGLLPF